MNVQLNKKEIFNKKQIKAELPFIIFTILPTFFFKRTKVIRKVEDEEELRQIENKSPYPHL